MKYIYSFLKSYVLAEKAACLENRVIALDFFYSGFGPMRDVKSNSIYCLNYTRSLCFLFHSNFFLFSLN